MATIRDVAKYAHVSISTVSLVLNGSDAVKETTRFRVKEAIEALQYHPNQSARSLVTKQNQVIGVIKATDIAHNTNHAFDGVVDTYVSEMLKSIGQESGKKGYSLLIDWCFGDGSDDTSHLLYGDRVDGIILVGGFYSEKIAGLLDRFHLPVTLIGSRSDSLDYVDTKPDVGIRLAFDYLYSCGHRKIALINGPAESGSSALKMEGFQQSLQEHGIAFDLQWTRAGNFTGLDGYLCMKSFWESDIRPTAVIAATDCMAIGAIRYMNEIGLRCPDDVSFIGFEDSILAEYSAPPLSSVCVHKEILGREGTKILLRRVQNSKVRQNRLLIEPELVLRSSVRTIDNGTV